MCGLWGARRDGIGCDCDVSLFETAMNLNMYVSTWHLSRGWEPERMRELGAPLDRAVPELPDRRRLDRDRLREGQVLRPAVRRARPRVDGRRSALLDDGGAARASRGVHRRALGRAAAATTRRSGSTACARPASPAGPVNDMAGAVGDPQTLARDLIAETEHPVLGTVRQIRSPLRVDGRLTELRPAPEAGRAHARGARRRAAATPMPRSIGSPRRASSATSRSERDASAPPARFDDRR